MTKSVYETGHARVTHIPSSMMNFTINLLTNTNIIKKYSPRTEEYATVLAVPLAYGLSLMNDGDDMMMPEDNMTLIMNMRPIFIMLIMIMMLILKVRVMLIMLIVILMLIIKVRIIS